MNTKEDKELFLKVNSVEPVFKGGGNWPGEPYLDGIKVWIGGEGHLFPCDQYTVCYPDEVREDGRNQVMALAIELGGMSSVVKQDLFGSVTVRDIFFKFPYEAIVEKLDAWKKEKEKIHIKDEVVQKLDSRLKFVVTEVHDGNGDTYISGVSKDGKVYPGHNIKNYKKTGLHVDDLDSYLEV